MVIDIGALSYVPTLALRASEMNGLEKLPGPTKDRIQPLFLLAPGVKSNSLGKAIERIEKAFPNRPYFLDWIAIIEVTTTTLNQKLTTVVYFLQMTTIRIGFRSLINMSRLIRAYSTRDKTHQTSLIRLKTSNPKENGSVLELNSAVILTIWILF